MESPDPRVAPAKELYRRMATRDLYVVVHTIQAKDAANVKKKEEKEEGILGEKKKPEEEVLDILAEIQDLVPEGCSGDGLKKDDFTDIRRRITNGERSRSENNKVIVGLSYSSVYAIPVWRENKQLTGSCCWAGKSEAASSLSAASCIFTEITRCVEGYCSER